jgi:DNA gyrase inhibitor GyrI
MKVAVFHGFGRSPEEIAFQKLRRWAERSDALSSDPPPRVFGFNNPNPSAGSESYGYDFWLELPEESPTGRRAEEEGICVEFLGGLYAALRHDGPAETIPSSWQRLVSQVAESECEHADHQWLEEHFPDLTADPRVLCLDCLMPIRR